MLNISNYELESANNTLIINDIKFEIDKIEIAGKYNIVLKIKNQNILILTILLYSTIYFDYYLFNLLFLKFSCTSPMSSS